VIKIECECKKEGRIVSVTDDGKIFCTICGEKIKVKKDEN